MLTEKKIQKYRNCLFMESVTPKKEAWTDDTGEQADFIRKHSNNAAKYYPKEWYVENHKVTTIMYAKVYEEYSKAFNIRNKKYKRAAATMARLEAKMLEK